MHPVEHSFQCPFCGAPVSMILEPLPMRQVYIEDCEVCCRPLEVAFRGDGREIVEFSVRAVEQ